MGSIRVRTDTGALFMDFKYRGRRLREQTTLADTPANRKRLQKALDRVETEIADGSFDYEKTFGKAPPVVSKAEPEKTALTAAVKKTLSSATPLFRDFADVWFNETEVSWRRSYRVTQRGALDKYLIPFFGDKEVGQIIKADVLAFRASLAKVTTRKSQNTLSNRRVNAVMKPLRQILHEAADRFEFTSAFTNIKPLKMKRSDVQPFTIGEVRSLVDTVRTDYRNYFIVRFLTGMRTAEAHGLKWKYVDFDRRLILVRESIVLNEEDELKTDGSLRDIQMTQMVYDALKAQHKATGTLSEYVFCNQAGQPINNQNFVNRVWSPLLRHLGLEKRRPYQMRHTAATLWLASGEAPEWIARQLGHTSTEMLFRVYSRYVPNLTRQDGSAMERLLASQMSQGALLPQTTPGSDVAVYVPAQDVAPMPQPKLRGVNGVRRVVGAGGVHPVPKDRSVHQTHNTNSVVGVGTDSPGTSALAQPPPVGWWFQSGALMSHHTHQHLNQP
jgi:integrase